MAKKDKFKLIFLIASIIVVFILLGLTKELPVWYFRLTTFSTDSNSTLQNRRSICAAMQPPPGRVSPSNLATIFPESFYKDKHFFEVYYSPRLKQCVYAGADVSVPMNASSSISFYIASPYLKNCVISQGSGWCVGSRGRGHKGGGGRVTMYRKNLIFPEIATPLPTAAPVIQERLILNSSSLLKLSVSTSGAKFENSHTPLTASFSSEPLLYKHRFGAVGSYSQYAKVYEAYDEMVHAYLER